MCTHKDALVTTFYGGRKVKGRRQCPWPAELLKLSKRIVLLLVSPYNRTMDFSVLEFRNKKIPPSSSKKLLVAPSFSSPMPIMKVVLKLRGSIKHSSRKRVCSDRWNDFWKTIVYVSYKICESLSIPKHSPGSYTTSARARRIFIFGTSGFFVLAFNKCTIGVRTFFNEELEKESFAAKNSVALPRRWTIFSNFPRYR